MSSLLDNTRIPYSFLGRKKTLGKVGKTFWHCVRCMQVADLSEMIKGQFTPEM